MPRSFFDTDNSSEPMIDLPAATDPTMAPHVWSHWTTGTS